MTQTLRDLVQLEHSEQEARGLVFTPREIAQQPVTWQGTLALFKRERARLCSFLERSGVQGPREMRPTVFLIGAGTSDYVAQAIVPLLRAVWQCQVLACSSTDLLPNLDDYVLQGTKYLWLSFSRSGDSPEGVAVLQQAMQRFPQIRHLVVTCNPTGAMGELARQHVNSMELVLDDVVNDRSLAMTSSFTNMVLMGQCLAHAWSLEDYLPIARQLVVAGSDLLERAFSLAQRLACERYPRVVVIGGGALAAVAKESALKILEMSLGKVKTMSETTLGLRHGPMAALDRETLLVCFLPSDGPRQRYALDLLREIGQKQIVAKRVAVGPAQGQAGLQDVCEEYLPLDVTVPDHYRPVLDVIFGQTLGLCTAIENGSRPDAPSSNDVITRVVQQFSIYQ